MLIIIIIDGRIGVYQGMRKGRQKSCGKMSKDIFIICVIICTLSWP